MNIMPKNAKTVESRIINLNNWGFLPAWELWKQIVTCDMKVEQLLIYTSSSYGATLLFI